MSKASSPQRSITLAGITKFVIGFGLLAALSWLLLNYGGSGQRDVLSDPTGQREEVVFWHFWGGEDRDVVTDAVRRFNESQDRYFVRAIAMPGNNLQAKLFLSVAGGDPPDIVNQDDPVIPDWAHRGVIHSLKDIASAEEVLAVRESLLPPALKLSVFQDEMFGLCNGLDIRALYYNKTLLDENGLTPPTSIQQLDLISETIAPPSKEKHQRYGYLPDTRRLLAWGHVFGGDFYLDAEHKATVDSPPIVDALNWMASYQTRYGADQIAAFRTGDQSLPGTAFPLLPIGDQAMAGRYAVVMDGQWRVRSISKFQKERRERGLATPEFGVCPLPTPDSINQKFKPRNNAGWVNGNFFVFPKHAKNSRGAWEFAKFWIGHTAPSQAADTCAAGGWIPVTQNVIDDRAFQKHLVDNPLFAQFVDLAASPNQLPTPQVVGAAMFKRTVETASYEAMFTNAKPVDLLRSANERIQQQLDRNRQGRTLEAKTNDLK